MGPLGYFLYHIQHLMAQWPCVSWNIPNNQIGNKILYQSQHAHANKDVCLATGAMGSFLWENGLVTVAMYPYK